MTELEISKRLALAIGWPCVEVYGVLGCMVRESTGANCKWQVFDYRDWNVIGPIAATYNCFPSTGSNGWLCGRSMWADTPQKAIALAVIQGAKT